jgi:hypothetical protein
MHVAAGENAKSVDANEWTCEFAEEGAANCALNNIRIVI